MPTELDGLPYPHGLITQDPIGLDGGINLYVYPLNPVTTTDPLGEKETRPDGHPWGYGYGDENTDRFVPDFLGAANFLHTFETPDACYGTLGSNKATCDKDLGADMKLPCKNHLTGIHKLFSPICNAMASGYEFAVSNFGNSAFLAEQKKAAFDYQVLEVLELLQFDLGVDVDPDYHSDVYNKVVNPR